MVSLAVNEIGDSGIPLGIVPSGTGNDSARGLGIPVDDTAAAIATLLAALDAPPRVVDVGLVKHGISQTRFVGIVSAGFDALVNDRANSWRRPRGRSRYTLALLRELVSLAPRRYELTVDGAAVVVDAVLISVANNVSIGGGMKIVPACEDRRRILRPVHRRAARAPALAPVLSQSILRHAYRARRRLLPVGSPGHHRCARHRRLRRRRADRAAPDRGRGAPRSAPSARPCADLIGVDSCAILEHVVSGPIV